MEVQYCTKWLETEWMKSGKVFSSKCAIVVGIIPLVVTARAICQISGLSKRTTKIHHKENKEGMALQRKALQNETWNEAPWMILI